VTDRDDIDRRAAAVHEAGHALAFGRRAITLGAVLIEDTGEPGFRRWGGRTYMGRGSIPTVESALAGTAAESAIRGDARPPGTWDTDWRDAGVVALAGDLPDDQAEREAAESAAIADPATQREVAAAWTVVFDEMGSSMDEINLIADAILAAQDFYLSPSSAANLVGELLGQPVEFDDTANPMDDPDEI